MSAERFNTEPLMLEIETVVKNGVNTILKDFMSKYELFEQTHTTIMNLKSELTQSKETGQIDDKESIKMIDTSYITNLVRGEVQKKFDIIEKKFIAIGPILDKILNKVHLLSEDVKVLKQQPPVEIISPAQPEVVPSIVSAGENENIKFEIIPLLEKVEQ